MSKHKQYSEENRKIIGTNVRFKRQEYNLTIEDLSEIVDIAPGFLGLIERGQRGTSIVNLIKISDFFGVTLDDLIKKDLSQLNNDEIVKTISKKQEIIDTICLILGTLKLAQLEYLYQGLIGLIKLMKLK